MRILFTVVVSCLVIASRVRCAESLSRREITADALRENPRLQAAHARWEMIKERIPQAKAWDDPMVGVDVERHGTTHFDTFSDNEWMISQALPLSGKNRARGRTAEAEALTAFEEVRRLELEVVKEVRTALARLAGAYEQLEINARNQELLGQLTEISRTKYESGTRSQADVLIAQTDLARLSETKALLQREVSDAQTQLNILMNRPASARLDNPPGLVFTPISWSQEKLEAFALANRPEVIKAQRQIEGEKARLQLARRQWFPDPRFRVEAREFRESGRIQEYDTGVFFEVPWGNFRKYSAGVAETKKGLEAVQDEYDAVRTEVGGLVRDQLKRIETAADNYRLFSQSIVPLARQTVEATRSSYESDQTSFLELMTARRIQQDADSAQLKHLIDHEIAVAELDAIIGRRAPFNQPGEEK